MSLRVQFIEAGKKFNREWVFKNLSTEFFSGQRVAILGSNGSGKSTLLQILSGFVSINKGEIIYLENEVKLNPENIYKKIALASPYLELIEDFTLNELLEHHRIYKPFVSGFDKDIFLSESGLNIAQNKLIKYYSSGMKQRVKLALAIYSDTPILLLDEPVSNLDEAGIQWFRKIILAQPKNKLIVIASNRVKDEYDFCSTILNIEDFKK